MDACQEGTCSSHLIVDSSSIMKTPASSWTFRVSWTSPKVATVSGQSSVRYDVQFIGEETGKRHTFRTTDDLPGIILPNRMVREKIGDTFTVQIRILNNDGVGEWSDRSNVLSVAKPSPNQVKQARRPQQSLSPTSATRPVVLEALPYTAARKVPVKKCGDAAKCRDSFLDRFISGFYRSTAKA